MQALVGPTFLSQRFGEKKKLFSLLENNNDLSVAQERRAISQYLLEKQSMLNVKIKGKIQEMSPVFQPIVFEVIKLNLLESQRHFVDACTTHFVDRLQKFDDVCTAYAIACCPSVSWTNGILVNR
jgi:hypothetical protein